MRIDNFCVICRTCYSSCYINRKRNKADAIFRRFLLEPDDTNEYLLCEAVPAVIRPLICELGKHLRTQQEYINEQKITVTDYEHYVENWVQWKSKNHYPL